MLVQSTNIIEGTEMTELRREIESLEPNFMGEEKIDAFNYASNVYGVASALKDGMKDKLKGMATLGTVRFNTVQTPNYLSLIHISM